MIYKKLHELIVPKKCNIVEIGAHIGTDTVKLWRMFEPLHYIAIEPDLRNIIKLRELDLPIKILEVAVGNKTGKVNFHFSSGQAPGNKRVHTDSNSLMRPKNNPAWVTFDRGKVTCCQLDYLMLPDNIDLIWMDVQGAELLVFEGAIETLKRTRYIYTECQEGRYEGQPGLSGIKKALPGWDVILRNGDNVLLHNKIYQTA